MLCYLSLRVCDPSRTLQLNAVPECLSYGGFGGELFLAIKGDLYKMNCGTFLPHFYQQMVTSQLAVWLTNMWGIIETLLTKAILFSQLLYTYRAEPIPDLPIIKNTETCSKRK